MVWQWTDVSRGRGKVNLLFRAFAGIWVARWWTDTSNKRASRVLSTASYRSCIYTCLYVRIYEVRHLHACTGWYTAYNRVYQHVYYQRNSRGSPEGLSEVRTVHYPRSRMPFLSHSSFRSSFNVLHIHPPVPRCPSKAYMLAPPLLLSHYIRAFPQSA